MWKMFRLMEEAGEADAGGSGDATGLMAEAGRQAEGEQGGEQGSGQQQGGEQQSQQQQDAAKPEYLSDAFWDADKGEPRLEALAKSQKDFERLAREKRGEVGTKPEDYTVSKLPEGFEVPEGDPLMSAARESALKNGIPKPAYDAFMQDLIGVINEAQKENAMTPEKEKAIMDEEKKLLGPNADAIMKRTWDWGKSLVKIGLWSEAEFNEIVGMGMNATGIKALSKLHAHYTKESIIPPKSSDTPGSVSKEEAYAMTRDPRYNTDPAYRAKVKQVFEDVFGDEPASTSERGLGVSAR
jgi:Phage T7 capsid assembly protein